MGGGDRRWEMAVEGKGEVWEAGVVGGELGITDRAKEGVGR